MDGRKVDKLLVRMSQGDNLAFSELYQKTSKGVFSFLYTYFHNYHDTEDAMQSVYLKIKRNISLYKPGTNGRAWMLQVAKNHALSELRKNSRVTGLDSVPEESYVMSDGSITDLLQRTLSEEDFRIVTLHVIWKYKHKEIAEILKMPVGTVTSKYKRSLAKVKEKLKEAHQ